MRKIVLALTVALVPALALAEDMWRWKDAQGVLHYSNIARDVPAGATLVDTHITLEVDRLPGAPVEPVLEMRGGQVVDPGERAPGRVPGVTRPRSFKPLPDAPRVYDEQRLRFGCFTAGTLYFGGFSHPDDISGTLNCYPYRLGPDAWLNAARAELAMRQNGINPRDMVQLYSEMTQPSTEHSGQR